MNPCKHLDHDEAKYGETCGLKSLEGFSCPVLYWKRKLVPYEGAPEKVQFCGQGRGRINSIFACYNEGEMSCYEPAIPSSETAPASRK
jgi:hypothetical protein